MWKYVIPTVRSCNNKVKYDIVFYAAQKWKSQDFGQSSQKTHLTFMGELWSVVCEYFGEKWTLL